MTIMNFFLTGFDLSNLTVLLLFLFPSMVNFGIALFVFFGLPKKSSNDFFIAFVLLLGLWQFCEGSMHLSITVELAQQWLRISHVPALLIIPVWFLFILKFTGWNKRISGVLIFTFFIAPALFFLLVAMARMDEYYFVQSEIFGWIVNPARNLSTISMYLWIAIGTLMIMAQLWVMYFKERKKKIIRKQVFLLAIGFTVPIIGGISFEIIRPVFWGMDNIPLASPLLTLFSFSIIIAITRHHFLEFSPHHQWENIIETMNEGIMIVNNEDNIMYANKKFCEMTGYPPEELRGKIAYELLLEDEQQKSDMQNKIKDRKKNISGQFELQVRKKSGEKRWLQINGAPCAGRNGNVIGSIGIHTDITEQKKIEADLILSETKFRTLFDSTRDAVMLLDNIGFFDCNLSTLKIFGCSTKEEFCSKHPADLSPPFQSCGTDSLTLANQRISTAMESGSNSFEWIHRRADTGKDFPAEVLLSRMELDGKCVLQATVRDITKRKKRESDFMASLKEISDYKYALNQSSSVSIADHQGTIRYANEKFCEISKYSKEELIGQNHRIFNSGYHPKEFFGDLWKTILNGKVWRQDVKSKAKDGTFFWSDTVIVPFVDTSGKPYQFVAIRNEITQRKKAEEALLRSETNLRAIFENTSTGFLLLDADFKIIKFNSRGSQLAFLAFGKELVGNINLLKILPAERQQLFFERQSRVLHGETINYETCYTLHDDSLLWLDINSKPVTDDRNSIIGISFAINDITERKKTEKKLLETIKEIDTFIFRSSHDLKSPVSSLKGLIMLMKKEISDKKALEYLIMVEKANLRMEDIVNDLSSVVLIKDERRKSVEINLFQEINSTIDLNKFSPGHDQIHYEVGVESDFRFFSDRTLISAICQNLIGNAIKYRMRDAGHIISIKAEKKSKGILLKVSDNGEGISIKPIEKIFEMFYRGNLKSTGTGLGLYIVKKAVEKLGGTIKVESEPRKGTTFSVYIPLGTPKGQF